MIGMRYLYLTNVIKFIWAILNEYNFCFQVALVTGVLGLVARVSITALKFPTLKIWVPKYW